MNAIVISDVHLRDATSLKTQLVLRFLQEKASSFEKIYILGDLFDVWPGTTDYLIKAFKPVTDVLKNLVKAGHEVHYLEGNHDFKLGRYFTEELGLYIYPNEIISDWNGKKVYMTHGDLGNPKELGYRALRYILRQDIVHSALNLLPSKWIFDAGMRASKASRAIQKGHDSVFESKIRHIYRLTAEKILEDGFDVVMMGHTHLPDDITIRMDGRTCRYLNSGDWVKNFTFLEFDGQEFYTKSHPVTGI